MAEDKETAAEVFIVSVMVISNKEPIKKKKKKGGVRLLSVIIASDHTF